MSGTFPEIRIIFSDLLYYNASPYLANGTKLLRNTLMNADCLKVWQRLFSEHNLMTLVHIPVHALCKYIFPDILQETARLKIDKEDVKNFEESQDYIKSWEYVEAYDYHKIIAELKDSYSEMKP